MSYKAIKTKDKIEFIDTEGELYPYTIDAGDKDAKKEEKRVNDLYEMYNKITFNLLNKHLK